MIQASFYFSPIILILIFVLNYIYFYGSSLGKLIITYTVIGIIGGACATYFFLDIGNTRRLASIAWSLVTIAILVYYSLPDTRSLKNPISAIAPTLVLINYYAISVFLTFNILKSLTKFKNILKKSITNIGSWLHTRPEASSMIVTTIITATSTIIVAIIGAIVTLIKLAN